MKINTPIKLEWEKHEDKIETLEKWRVEHSLEKEKTQRGQFYTEKNPFDHIVVKKWAKAIQQYSSDYASIWLEPFAGCNSLVKHSADVKLHPDEKRAWKCYDIAPETLGKNITKVPVEEKDTISSFPNGFAVGVSNPPYLAKNSATRRGLSFPETKFDDLYKHCLSLMLDSLRWVAVIIPESFLTSGLFKERLYATVSLTKGLFEDTEEPVCLAFFVPSEIKPKLELDTIDFFIYVGEEYVGKYSSLEKKLLCPKIKNEWTFNDPVGKLGLLALDNNEKASVHFVQGNEIPTEEIKISSRTRTRISGLPDNIPMEQFILKANLILYKFRKDSHDVFMTAFKGLRKDGKYRRRLDWKVARLVLNKTLDSMEE